MVNNLPYFVSTFRPALVGQRLRQAVPGRSDGCPGGAAAAAEEVDLGAAEGQGESSTFANLGGSVSSINFFEELRRL